MFVFALLLTMIPVDMNAAEKDRPIRALLVTGGCCHDYSRQKLILTKGVSARANVVWTVVHQGGTTTNTKIPLYEDPNWAEGFDIIVHNECFAGVKDQAWLDRILEPHRNGTPAILIHCAMHCYRTGTDDWFEFAGVQSPGHGAHYPFEVENLNPDHFIMSAFGDKWTAPKGELYHSVKVFPTATPLGHAKRKNDNKPQTCVWTNDYRGTRVFATTIGHYNETMVEPNYLDMMTRGLLWAVGREDDQLKEVDEETTAEIQKLVTIDTKKDVAPQQCCGMGNLALGGPATAKSEQKGNFIRHAFDGNLDTRWAPSGSQKNEWIQVDFGKADHLKSVRIHWEFDDTAYQYTIEGSPDGDKWNTIVDASDNQENGMVRSHKVDAPDTRFLRVNYLDCKKGTWGSIWEIEAYAGELPPLPKKAEVSATTTRDVQAPDDFDVRIFGAPPKVNYPVCLTATANGDVYIGIDETGSLGKELDRGRVVRCRDIDGDGTADEIKTFAEMDHPRGLFYDNGSLWVLHPPFLTVFHDDNDDGVSDREEQLISGISTDQVNQRGADHTTNGIRMGIDGWIYIAVGDFGFVNATGTDGTKLSRRGGGIVRVRPNGKEMEVFSWGQRNILDVCIDPYMNIFTRDNTNDGGGWDIRVSHVIQSANYGYPSLYWNFPDEIMPPLADYGGGSGCGSFYMHDARWPDKYGDALYTCDWGRSEVYRHKLPSNGATFDPHQETFLQLPRPTDIDVDGSGRMYVSSWKNGKFSFSGPDVGFVAQVVPTGFLPKPFPVLEELNGTELVKLLKHENMKHRVHAQFEILRRDKLETDTVLKALIQDGEAPLYGRVAALWTFKQQQGTAANAYLITQLEDDAIAEQALRCLTDRLTQLDGIDVSAVTAKLNSSDARVVTQTIISLGRLSNVLTEEETVVVSNAILETAAVQDLTLKPYNQANAARVIPHVAVQNLIRLHAVETCLAGLNGSTRPIALWALRSLHGPNAISGLVAALDAESDSERRLELITLLIRLYHREGEYAKGDWWGTRPDRSGPYYDRKTWQQSERIAGVLKHAIANASEADVEKIAEQLKRHKVSLDGLPKSMRPSADPSEPVKAIEFQAVDPNNPDQIANMKFEDVVQRAMAAKGKVNLGKKLFLSQNCAACHTYKQGQTPKGPHLVDIGKRYKKAELIESILKPNAKIAQGFDTYGFITMKGKLITGFVVGESAEEVHIRQANGLSTTILQDDIDERAKQKQSMMPERIVNNLTPEQLADIVRYLQSL